MFTQQPQYAELQIKSMQNKLLVKKYTSGERIALYCTNNLHRQFMRSYTFSKGQTYLNWNIPYWVIQKVYGGLGVAREG